MIALRFSLRKNKKEQNFRFKCKKHLTSSPHSAKVMLSQREATLCSSSVLHLHMALPITFLEAVIVICAAINGPSP